MKVTRSRNYIASLSVSFAFSVGISDKMLKRQSGVATTCIKKGRNIRSGVIYEKCREIYI